MSFRKNFVGASIAAALLALLPASPALAGVVVAASGPSAKTYPVGRKIGPTDKIVLQAGDTLTVLDEKGTRVLRGAGSYTLATQTGADKSNTFALLTRQRSAQRMRTGAVRDSNTGPVTRPNLWYVDVRQAGPMCLADPTEVRLWRPATAGEQLYAIGVGPSQVASRASFGDGDMLTVWDLSQAPITDGAKYVIAGGDGKPNEITFRVLDPVPEDAEALAATLIEMGCNAQLDVLSSAMIASEE
ncbi:hypothetical protein A6F68_00044 [Tsuneonella dongtanensis]|uniref:Uncharacterized protein n=1 Tax=Tsuneonella dongtanensis TaxID=692370 RepID=A0A1B2A8T8_9SPHN|nr:hypothetical protein [Tsuneonella dongtanensis]ANY18580.1 hypothetical protein A6F68_00044 [Tsuneonella dongtanensis]